MLSVIEGQVSIFDIQSTIEKINNIDDEVVSEYKNDAIRIIKCFSGGYCIETEKEEIVLHANGKEFYRGEWIKFNIENLRELLPMDKILFTKYDLNVNENQEKILEGFKKVRKIEKVIKRVGDPSYIVITSDGYFGVNVNQIDKKGRVIEYIRNPIYKNNEVIWGGRNNE